MYCTGDLFRLLIYDLASIFGVGALQQENLKIAQSRQKSYADKKRQAISFQVGDHVYLRVSPMRGVQRFRVRGKLAPRYVGPFPIIERCGPVAYRVELPP